MFGQEGAEAVFHRKIPAVEGGMVAVQPGKLLHHLLLAAANGGVTQVVVLVFGPAGTHEYLHAEACGGIHDGIYRAFTPFGIDVGHQ